MRQDVVISVRFCAVLCLLICSWANAQDSVFNAATYVGDIESSDLDHLSGMEPSTHTDNLYWAHSDRGGERIYAMDGSGRHRGLIEIKGKTQNTDWEDMTSYRENGESFLVLADTGGNKKKNRRYHDIVCIREPQLVSGKVESQVEVVWDVRFTYEKVKQPNKKKPDCESIAVHGDDIFLLLKEFEEEGTRLFRIPISNAKRKDKVVAELVTSIKIKSEAADDRSNRLYKPTSLDISDDGKMAIVLTYGHAYAFTRNDGQEWKDAFEKSPVKVRLPRMLQAECICFDRANEAILVSSERRDNARAASIFRIAIN